MGIDASFSGNGLVSSYINIVLDGMYVLKVGTVVHWLKAQQRHNCHSDKISNQWRSAGSSMVSQKLKLILILHV
jgi:hypothetical protein